MSKVYMNKDFLKKSKNINKYLNVLNKISEYDLKYKNKYEKEYNYALKHNIFFGGKKINKSIFSNIYTENKPIKSKFIKNNSINETNNDTPYDMFKKLSKEMDDIGKKLDKYSQEKYGKVSSQFEIFKNKKFKEDISKLYGFHVSQGGIKMNEMISTFKDLIPTNKKIVKSFHICEAPGSFIHMIRFYVNDILGNKLEWKAQSLNPFHKDNIKKYGKGILKLDENLTKDKNGEWLTGTADGGTGDITDLSVTKEYAKYCKDVDIITSDCGLGEGIRGAHADRIMFYTILFMLMNVPLGKNCLMKLYLPITDELYIYMIYLLYRYFKKVYIYKPIVNFRSEEFYIVCIGKKKIPEKLIKKLSKKTIEYPNVSDLSFLLQLYDYIKLIIDKRQVQLERLVYLMDNYDLITKSEFKLMGQIKQKRFKEWIKQYNLLK